MAASLVYFSTSGRERPESGVASTIRSGSRRDDARSALIAALRAVDAATEDFSPAEAAVERLRRALTPDKERTGQRKLPLTYLKILASQTQRELEAAMGSVETAVRLTSRGLIVARTAEWADDPFGHLEAAERRLDLAMERLSSASEELADAEQALLELRAAGPTALDRALPRVEAVARSTKSVSAFLAQASKDLDMADRRTPDEAGFPPFRWILARAPVEFLQRWLGGLRRDVSAAAPPMVVVGLVLIFGLIAFAILDVSWFLIGLAAGALIALAAVLLRVGRPMLAVVTAVLVVPVVGAIGLLLGPIHPWYSAGVVAVSLLTIWLTAGAMSRWSSAKATAWVLFAAIAFWAGALVFLRERGARHPELEVAFVKSSTSGDTFEGFYLGRTSDHVYLASTEPCKDDGCRRVLIIGEADAACLAFQDPEEVPREKEDDVPHPNTHLTAFNPGSNRVCEPETSEPDDDRPTKSVKHSERNLSLGFDLDIAPRRSEVVRRQRRNLSLDFDFDASPRLSLFSGPSDTRTQLALASEIFFRFEDDQLTLGARRKLRNLARLMRRSRPKQVYVYGHADEKGSPEENDQLSERRAERVSSALVRRHAISRSRLEPPIGLGQTAPAVCGQGRNSFDDPRSRVYNRRVEIYTELPPAVSSGRCPR